MAKPNPEYQRGVVWTTDQQMRLIDSVMRGYQLPIIYLHDIKREVAGRIQESYDIIDGQQRIHALHLFVEGAFSLYEPDDKKARFPKFLREQPCPWGGKDYRNLPGGLKTSLLNTKLPVAFIETDDGNEVRDLFVRLQAGLPLNSQEKRDSYPGQFTEFVLGLGGKPEIPRYPGHAFFRRILRMKPERDRGTTRQLAAQIAILFLERHDKGRQHFTDINTKALDDYYYRHLDFDASTSACQRLIDILSKLNELLGEGNRPKLRAHDAIHLVLFVDSLWDDYTRSWESTLPSAQDKFSEALARAAKTKNNQNPEEAWLRYGVWTRTNSDRGDSIRHRHQFYSQRMATYIGNLAPKDSKRAFGSLDREIIYWRDDKKCGVCGSEVLWAEAEIHHIKEHIQSGRTELTNGQLVHRHCHPKAGAAKEFAVQVLKKTAKSLDSQALPAEGDLPAEAPLRRHATPAAVTQIMERIGYDASDPTDRDRALKAAWREAARSGLIPYERCPRFALRGIDDPVAIALYSGAAGSR